MQHDFLFCWCRFVWLDYLLQSHAFKYAEYDPSGKSNLSVHMGADILNLFLLYADLMFFHL